MSLLQQLEKLYEPVSSNSCKKRNKKFFKFDAFHARSIEKHFQYFKCRVITLGGILMIYNPKIRVSNQFSSEIEVNVTILPQKGV